MIARETVIEEISARFTAAHGRAPETHELIFALADVIEECGRQISPGYMRWKPARPVRPPKPQRPAITDDEPETATE